MHELYAANKKQLSYGEQKDIIYDCQKQIGDWYGYFSQNIRMYRDDRLFYQGQQWPDWTIKMLQEENIPEIVVNLIKPIVRVIMGSILELDPQLTLVPTDTKYVNGAELEVFTDLLRATAYNTEAALAYSMAAENMLTGGWGVVQTGTRYSKWDTFNQEFFVRGIREPMQVFFDHNSTHPSKSDSKKQGMFTFMSETEYKKRYPKAPPPDRSLISNGIPYYDFMTTDDVCVAEYYVTDYKNEKLIALSNGVDYAVEVTKEQVKKEQEKYYQMQAARGITQLMTSPLIEVRSRETARETIMCYELNGEIVLDSYEYISKYMPFVFFDCNSTYRDGKQWTESFIYPAKDSQRIYNFCLSQAVYATEIMRKERIFATPEQTEGYEDLYKYPQKALAFMPYNPDPLNPNPPIIVPPAEISMTYFKEAEVAAYDIQRILGVYEPSKGQLVGDASGVANMTAMLQANQALKCIVEKMFIGMEQVGRNCMDILPKIYDTQRVVKTQKPNGEIVPITVNQFDKWDPHTNEPVFKNDITKAMFELQVKAGASFEAQRQIEDQKLMGVLSLNPEFATSGGDLMASRIGTPAGIALSKRLSAFVPPQALAAEKGEKFNPPPNPAEQMALQKMQAEVQETQAKAQKMMEEVKIEQQKVAQTAQELEIRNQEMMAKFYETIMKGNAEIKKATTDAEVAVMEQSIDLHKFHSTQKHQVRMSERAPRKKATVTKSAD